MPPTAAQRVGRAERSSPYLRSGLARTGSSSHKLGSSYTPGASRNLASSTGALASTRTKSGPPPAGVVPHHIMSRSAPAVPSETGAPAYILNDANVAKTIFYSTSLSFAFIVPANTSLKSFGSRVPASPRESSRSRPTPDDMPGGYVAIAPIARSGLPAFRLSDLVPSEYHDLCSTIPRVTALLERVFKATAFKITIHDGQDAGQTVPHLHVKIVPRCSTAFPPAPPDQLPSPDAAITPVPSKPRTSLPARWAGRRRLGRTAAQIFPSATRLFHHQRPDFTSPLSGTQSTKSTHAQPLQPIRSQTSRCNSLLSEFSTISRSGVDESDAGGVDLDSASDSDDGADYAPNKENERDLLQWEGLVDVIDEDSFVDVTSSHKPRKPHNKESREEENEDEILVTREEVWDGGIPRRVAAQQRAIQKMSASSRIRRRNTNKAEPRIRLSTDKMGKEEPEEGTVENEDDDEGVLVDKEDTDEMKAAVAAAAALRAAIAGKQQVADAEEKKRRSRLVQMAGEEDQMNKRRQRHVMASRKSSRRSLSRTLGLPFLS